jgi:predicted DNA-binding transcriptional regulator AlpA
MNTAHIDLVGIREISARTGMSVAQVSTWMSDPDFPESEADLASGSIWVWGPVHRWLHQHHFRSDVDLL